MKNFLKDKKVRFAIAAIIYLLFVIWIQNYFLLLGLAIIFDNYFTRKVRWAFWKRWDENKVYIKEKKGSGREWTDALIFAISAAYIIRLFFIEAYTIPTSSLEGTLLRGDYLFVSKVNYGPRMPMTPLAVPFVHHSLPGTTTKAYSEWPSWDYKRLAGFEEIENDDIVVFNFPEGDTLTAEHQSEISYYQIVREIGHKETNKRFNIVSRPIDKRENYVKRCVAIPGDKFEIKNGQIYINNKPQQNIETLQFNYVIVTNGSKIKEKRLDKIGVSLDDIYKQDNYLNSCAPNFFYQNEQIKKHLGRKLTCLPLTKGRAGKVKNLSNVIDTIKYMEYGVNPRIFPHDTTNFKWNNDNMGPIVMPKEGATVELNTSNIALYKRVITSYEGNTLKVVGNDILINDEKVTSYTFKQGYYWLMGDNRHNSQDSRFWGFVPEDHVVGKPVFVWLSIDPDRSWAQFGDKIRWRRLFNIIHKD